MTSKCDYAEKGGERSWDVSFKRTNQGEYDICVYVYSIFYTINEPTTSLI